MLGCMCFYFTWIQHRHGTIGHSLVSGEQISWQKQCHNALQLEPQAKSLKLARVISLAWLSLDRGPHRKASKNFSRFGNFY